MGSWCCGVVEHGQPEHGPRELNARSVATVAITVHLPHLPHLGNNHLILCLAELIFYSVGLLAHVDCTNKRFMSQTLRDLR